MLRKAFDERFGSVRGAIGDDDDLDELGRVFEVEDRAEFIRDEFFAVVHRKNKGDGGAERLGIDGTGAIARQKVQQQRIAEGHIEQESDRGCKNKFWGHGHEVRKSSNWRLMASKEQ